MTALLSIDGVSKRFRGLLAVDNASFRVTQGSIFAVIGPNGAGKTTLFNIIAGVLTPDQGSIIFADQRVDGLRPDEISRRGIGRTFQLVRPFPALSVEDNVIVGAMLLADLTAARSHAHEVLRRLDLFGKRDQLAAGLTLPDRKRLEVARALATDPKLLLLDEVMAGLRPAETDRMVAILTGLNRESGLTILLIEHVMRAVMALAERVLVLHHGAAIAEGPPDAVVREPAVVNPISARRPSTDAACRAPRCLPWRRPGTRRRVYRDRRGDHRRHCRRQWRRQDVPHSHHCRHVSSGARADRVPRHRYRRLGKPPGLQLGIGQVAEGRQVFPTLSVAENLDMGAMVPRARAGRAQNLERVLALFPVLAERAGQAAGTLSGGEQQMLAIGRCLMGAPELVMFDEPSLGLAPAVVQHVLRTIRDLNREGLTCVLVEQNVAVSLRLAAHAYVLENGRVTLSGSGEGLLADDRVRQAYLGM